MTTRNFINARTAIARRAYDLDPCALYGVVGGSISLALHLALAAIGA